MGTRRNGCLNNILRMCIRPAVGYVFRDGSGKQERILHNHTDLRMKIIQFILFNINPVDKDLSFVHIVKAGNQVS